MTTTSAWHDSIVAEIHATRERLAEQYHNDLLAYSKAAEARCHDLGLTMADDPHAPTVPVASGESSDSVDRRP